MNDLQKYEDSQPRCIVEKKEEHFKEKLRINNFRNEINFRTDD